MWPPATGSRTRLGRFHSSDGGGNKRTDGRRAPTTATMAPAAVRLLLLTLALLAAGAGRQQQVQGSRLLPSATAVQLAAAAGTSSRMLRQQQEGTDAANATTSATTNATTAGAAAAATTSPVKTSSGCSCLPLWFREEGRAYNGTCSKTEPTLSVTAPNLPGGNESQLAENMQSVAPWCIVDATTCDRPPYSQYGQLNLLASLMASLDWDYCTPSPGVTSANCSCDRVWGYGGLTFNGTCENPDNDPRGPWCFVQEESCTGTPAGRDKPHLPQAYDYCTPSAGPSRPSGNAGSTLPAPTTSANATTPAGAPTAPAAPGTTGATNIITATNNAPSSTASSNDDRDVTRSGCRCARLAPDILSQWLANLTNNIRDAARRDGVDIPPGTPVVPPEGIAVVNGSCANPDNDPLGAWCTVDLRTCTGVPQRMQSELGAWDYCGNVTASTIAANTLTSVYNATNASNAGPVPGRVSGGAAGFAANAALSPSNEAAAEVLNATSASGCRCRVRWYLFAGEPGSLFNRPQYGCDNPDRDPKGQWCVVDPFSCTTGQPTGVVASTGEPYDFCGSNADNVTMMNFTTIAGQAISSPGNASATNVTGTMAGMGTAGNATGSALPGANEPNITVTTGKMGLDQPEVEEGSPAGPAGSTRVAAPAAQQPAGQNASATSNTTTLAGCRCRPSWGYEDPATGEKVWFANGGCQLPDNDPAGPWCFVDAKTCNWAPFGRDLTGLFYDYCTPPPAPRTQSGCLCRRSWSVATTSLDATDATVESMGNVSYGPINATVGPGNAPASPPPELLPLFAQLPALIETVLGEEPRQRFYGTCGNPDGDRMGPWCFVRPESCTKGLPYGKELPSLWSAIRQWQPGMNPASILFTPVMFYDYCTNGIDSTTSNATTNDDPAGDTGVATGGVIGGGGGTGSFSAVPSDANSDDTSNNTGSSGNSSVGYGSWSAVPSDANSDDDDDGNNDDDDDDTP